MAKRKPTTPPEETPAAAPENYTVLARRYRPQQFNDIIGQEPVARALVNALQSNRVAHAYLFTGARGVGKTSTARILAKALNCEKGPTATPCDQCDICKSIASGEDVDVLEIDGASNRGIDEVREIRLNVQYRPSRSRYKIYIIDEVHMLTPPAFNALLKTLEEPPAHVKFIFATTEAQKIPITILSRCQRFDFSNIGTPRIAEQLRQVVTAEGMQADAEALELIARRAGGSMRDAQSLLDQLLAFGGDRLTSELVHRLLGTAHEDRVAGLAAAVLDRDPRRALELFSQAAEEGLQLGELLDQLLAYWRDLMVIHCAGAEARDLSVPSRLRDTLTQQATALSLDTILAGLDILAATRARMRGSNHGRVLMEMALVRLGRLDSLVALSELAQLLGGEQPAQVPQRSPANPGTPSDRLPPPTQVAAPETVKKKTVASPESTPALAPRALTAESVQPIWKEVLAQLPPILAHHVEKAHLPAISGPNTLVLGFPSAYNAEREHCQGPQSTARIEDVLRKITGRGWNLRIETIGGDGATQQPPATEDTESSQSRQRRQRDEAEREPLVKRALEVLGAHFVRVDEGFGAAPLAAAESPEPVPSEEE